MEPSQKHSQEARDLECHSRVFNWKEAAEFISQFIRLSEFGADLQIEEQRRQDLLAENPKGFQLDGIGYTCFICGQSTQDRDNWYDKWGIKCMTCQKAINRKEIPASLAKNQDSWYSSYDLQSRFNIKAPTIGKWIRLGIIKARTVTRDGKRAHARLFLIKDNQDFLPPKKLTKLHMVKEIRNGKELYRSEPWYQFVNLREQLKGYGIMEHVQLPPPK